MTPEKKNPVGFLRPEPRGVRLTTPPPRASLNRRHDLAAPPRALRLLPVAGGAAEGTPRRAPLATGEPSRPMPGPRVAGATEASVPRLAEPPGFQGHPGVVGRRGRGGGRTGDREAGDLGPDRGEARRAGLRQALPHPGSACCVLIRSCRPIGFV